jgi:hypothetical protein
MANSTDFHKGFGGTAGPKEGTNCRIAKTHAVLESIIPPLQ